MLSKPQEKARNPSDHKGKPSDDEPQDVEKSKGEPKHGKPKTKKGAKPSSSGSKNPTDTSGRNPTSVLSRETLDFLSKSVVLAPTADNVPVEISVRTDKILQIADLTYARIVEVMPQAAGILGPKCFRHIFRLLLQRRVEDVHFALTGTKPPAATRVPLPKDVPIPQVLWDILASIGSVEEPDANIEFSPRVFLPNAQFAEDYDIDYIMAIDQCYAQNWSQSWQEAKDELDKLDKLPSGILSMLQADRDTNVEASEGPSTPPLESHLSKEAIISLLKELDKSRRQASGAQRLPVKQVLRGGVIYIIPKDAEVPEALDELKKLSLNTLAAPSLSDNEDLSRSDLTAMIFKAKDARQKWKPQDASDFRPNPVYVQDKDQDIGAYGRFLGWSPELWLRFRRFVELTKAIMLYSLSFPNDKAGTMAYVLPVTQDESGAYFSTGPTRRISPADFALAVFIQTGNFDDNPGWASNWMVRSERLTMRDDKLQSWILNMIKQPSTATPTNF